VGSLDGEKGGRSAEGGVARNVNTENSYSSVKSNVNGEWMGGMGTFVGSRAILMTSSKVFASAIWRHAPVSPPPTALLSNP